MSAACASGAAAVRGRRRAAAALRKTRPRTKDNRCDGVPLPLVVDSDSKAIHRPGGRDDRQRRCRGTSLRREDAGVVPGGEDVGSRPPREGMATMATVLCLCRVGDIDAWRPQFERDVAAQTGVQSYRIWCSQDDRNRRRDRDPRVARCGGGCVVEPAGSAGDGRARVDLSSVQIQYLRRGRGSDTLTGPRRGSRDEAQRACSRGATGRQRLTAAVPRPCRGSPPGP